MSRLFCNESNYIQPIETSWGWGCLGPSGVQSCWEYRSREVWGVGRILKLHRGGSICARIDGIRMGIWRFPLIYLYLVECDPLYIHLCSWPLICSWFTHSTVRTVSPPDCRCSCWRLTPTVLLTLSMLSVGPDSVRKGWRKWLFPFHSNVTLSVTATWIGLEPEWILGSDDSGDC